jgi:outer membrane lipoprotein-sorting protein
MVHAETLEEVEKKISRLTEKHDSLQLKMKSKSDFTLQGASTKTNADSSTAISRQGDKWLFRMDSTISSRIKSPEQPDEMKQDMKVTQVYDGRYMWVLNDVDGNKSAMKTKLSADEMKMLMTSENWQELHKHMHVKLAGEEKVEGKSCWAIETRPKLSKEEQSQAARASDPMAEATTRSYYSKENGVVLKVVTRDKNGDVIQTAETTDVKLNAKVDPELFKFKAPEGVQIADMTEMDQPQPFQEVTAESNSAAEGSPPPADDKKADDEQQEKPKTERKKGLGGLLKKLR